MTVESGKSIERAITSKSWEEREGKSPVDFAAFLTFLIEILLFLI